MVAQLPLTHHVTREALLDLLNLPPETQIEHVSWDWEGQTLRLHLLLSPSALAEEDDVA